MCRVAAVLAGAILLLVVVLLFAAGGGARGAGVEDTGFSGGSGSADDPFLISSAAELDNVRNYLSGYHFLLTGNIDLAEYIDSIEYDEDDSYATNSITGFAPIGDFDDHDISFSGVFDGGGYAVRGLRIDAQMYNVGLFSRTYGATIKNLIVETAGDGVLGAGRVGIIAGRMTQTKVTGCRVAGRVSGVDTVGGIAGEAISGSSIIGCKADAEVVSYGVYAGGIAGYLSAAEVTDCFAAGDIACRDMIDETGTELPTDHMYIGGIAGGFEGRQIKCSLFTGKITGANGYYGGLVGEFAVDYSSDDLLYTGKIVSSFYALSKDPLLSAVGNEESLPISVNVAGFGKTDEELLLPDTYNGWDMENTWAFDDGGHPYIRTFPPAGIRSYGGETPPNLLWLWITLGSILFVAAVAVIAFALKKKSPKTETVVVVETVYVHAGNKELPANVSPREREIAGLVLQGYKRTEIARSLYISEGTVKIHIKNLLEKVECQSQKDFIIKYK